MFGFIKLARNWANQQVKIRREVQKTTNQVVIDIAVDEALESLRERRAKLVARHKKVDKKLLAEYPSVSKELRSMLKK